MPRTALVRVAGSIDTRAPDSLRADPESWDSRAGCWPGQASEHDADHCETNEGGGGLRVAFEVAGEAPIAANPGECSLDQRLYNVARS